MLTTTRSSNALLPGATKDVLLRLFTQPGSLQRTRTFPVRKLMTSPHLAPASGCLYQHASRPAPTRHTLPACSARNLRSNSNNTRNPPSPYELGGHQPPKQESKFKQLSRRYGWAAVGVYFGLSVLDFPFCFLAVRWLGSERIAAAEEWVVDGFWTVTEKAAPGARESYKARSTHLRERYREWRGLQKMRADGPLEDTVEMAEEVQRQKRHHEASLGTQLALAYALHKSLIFFRLPLTASITPGIVKWLRKRGWNIGNAKKSTPAARSK